MTTRREFLASSAFLLVGSGMPAALAAPLITSKSPRRLTRVIEGAPTLEGAGVRLKRVIGQPRLRLLDPFILLDRFHSADPADYRRGFPSHPHRGFETITVMLAGRMKHKDSRGNEGIIGGGGIQWMTAGRGIIHSEMPEGDNGLMSGFQFWLNLPAREKMRAPEYNDMQRADIPAVSLNGRGDAQIIAGRALGKTGAVDGRTTEPTLLTVNLEDDSPLAIDTPRGHTAFIFVHRGEVFIEGQRVPAGFIGVLSDGDRITLRAQTMRSGLIVATAKPLREPIVQRGPFVMNSEAEIRQAWEDYRSGALAR